jgi:hypothetical protein
MVLISLNESFILILGGYQAFSAHDNVFALLLLTLKYYSQVCCFAISTGGVLVPFGNLFFVLGCWLLMRKKYDSAFTERPVYRALS